MIDTDSTRYAAAIVTTALEQPIARIPCPVCGGELDAQWCRGCSGRGGVNTVGDTGHFEWESCDRCSGTGSEFWCEVCGVNR